MISESSVGDITPWEGIPKEEKHRLEAEAMHNFVHDMLHNSPAAQRIESLWRVSPFIHFNIADRKLESHIGIRGRSKSRG
jgi:hypothetical protein